MKFLRSRRTPTCFALPAPLTVWQGGTPPSFGIKDLEGSTRQVFGFKGLAAKVFKNQRLNLSKSAENGFGAVSRSVFVDRRASKLPQSDLYRHAPRGLSQSVSITDGCDEKGVCPVPEFLSEFRASHFSKSVRSGAPPAISFNVKQARAILPR